MARQVATFNSARYTPSCTGKCFSGNMVALLVEGIKEMYKEVTLEFSALKNENEELRTRIQALESWACSQTPRPTFCNN